MSRSQLAANSIASNPGCVKSAVPSADKASMDDRRSEVRMLCADMVEVRWRDRLGHQRGTTAILEDICPSGACLQVEERLRLWPPHTMAGEGSKFRAAFSSSEATVRPKIASPSRICFGARPAKLNRNAPGSSRETAKYLPGMYATPARCARASN